MIRKENRIAESGSGRANSVYTRTAEKRRWVFMAGLVLTVLLLTAGFGCMQIYAGTSDNKTRTVVITTESDEQFAAESAKLAKKSRGLMIQSTGKAKAYSSGRLIVSLEEGKTVDFSKYKATTVVESNFGIYLVQFSSGNAAKKAAKKIAALSAVTFVEPDDCSVNIGDTEVKHISLDGGILEDDEEDSSDDWFEINGTGLDRNAKPKSGFNGDQVYQDTVTAEAATVSSNAMSWGSSFVQADKYAAFIRANTKRGIRVAVVDSGVSYHTKLKGRILTGKDYVDNDSNPSDRNGHGTHVAGVIVDCTPGINVKILPVRVMNASGNGHPSAVGNGIRYAVNKGAKVINLSLGAYQHYKYIEQCITYAHQKGVTVVVAAGNECTNTRYICPAHMSSPIVVGAINSNGKRAGFSNYGSSLDISAPGVNIRSCWLNGRYATASGTSMAAPHITAVAAMYRIMNPTANASRTQNMVRCYAWDLGAKGTDKYYGRGVPRMAGAITPSKVTLPRTQLTMQIKKSVTLKASIIPYYAGKKKLTWTSSNSKVATVSGGKITAKGRGTAVITVKTVNGKKATCKVTVTNAKVTASGVRISQGSEKKAASASSSAEKAAVGKSIQNKDPVSAASAMEEVKIYIYPSDREDNAPVQDGSITAGSRLALDAEIVPARSDPVTLEWKSSNPDIAAVDEKGIVTALSAGEAQISAVLPGTDSGTDTNGSRAAPGTYIVKVVRPSVLTRHASYSAGQDREVNIETVLRVPFSLKKRTGEGADSINPAADYVLAILDRDDKDCTLLGAVNLGGDDSGTVHCHDSENGSKRSELTEIKAGSEKTLADLSSGKKASETGILYVRNVNADGCKADLSLTANIDALRTAVGAAPAGTEKLSDCVIAIYSDKAFEEREGAAEKKDKETIRRIDEEAVCVCSFSLSYEIPEQEETVTEDPAGETSKDAQPDPGRESRDGAAETDKTSEDAAEAEEAEGSDENSSSSGKDTAAAEEAAEKPPEEEPAADAGKTEAEDGVTEEKEPAASGEDAVGEENKSTMDSIEEPVKEQSFSGDDPDVSQEQAEKPAVSESAPEEITDQN